MKVVFTDLAIVELNKIAEDSRREFGDVVTEELEKKFRQIVGAIAMAPKGGSRVIARPGVHSMPLVRYPFKIYYRIADETVEVIHIHHTSQRPRKE